MQADCQDSLGYRDVRAAVVGAAGFIGRWVARALCMRGAQVFLLVRDAAAARKLLAGYNVRGEITPVDAGDEGLLEKRFLDICPSVTFNLAGYGVRRHQRDPILAERTNANLVQRLAKAVARSRDPQWPGQDLIHVGSALEYGAADGDLAEHSPARPTTLYGQAKLAGTERLAAACRDLGIRGLTARLFTVYGPGEPEGRLLPSLLETARTGRRLPLTEGRQRRDFTFVGDAAEGLLRLGRAQAVPGEIVNLATGRLTPVRGFIETAAKVLGIPADRLRFGALPAREDEMRHSEVNVARLRQLAGWLPGTRPDEGIALTAEFVAAMQVKHD